ncbi:hypothetical protein D8T49_21495 [Vibrio vulnificus]|uniref:hypothetical protein n=1 Tax=Vibrio vulnificus TaxID=672 RepID=UPI001023082C|nr:hypothetical protein [Vibrio vulnificus]MCU8190153.1 hypothetical protein [Vibrio vulnificus]RZP97179.1 hypothetical protein D8T37_21025 [Vibrio vulnificus]RZQ44352.1 hypothetical protein D8T49_21495 [Vibrio vulnificus]
MFTYIFKGKSYSDTSRDFMLNLGMDTEAIESVLQQKEFEEGQSIELRAKAYKRESDPLYIEWQYELETANPKADDFKQKWMHKVTEIKARYPLPSES